MACSGTTVLFLHFARACAIAGVGRCAFARPRITACHAAGHEIRLTNTAQAAIGQVTLGRRRAAAGVSIANRIMRNGAVCVACIGRTLVLVIDVLDAAGRGGAAFRRRVKQERRNANHAGAGVERA